MMNKKCNLFCMQNKLTLMQLEDQVLCMQNINHTLYTLSPPFWSTHV
jgi:hypothetical protein